MYISVLVTLKRQQMKVFIDVLQKLHNQKKARTICYFEGRKTGRFLPYHVSSTDNLIQSVKKFPQDVNLIGERKETVTLCRAATQARKPCFHKILTRQPTIQMYL